MMNWFTEKKKKGITPYLRHDTILEFDFLGFHPFTLYSLAITGLIVFPKPGVNLHYSTASSSPYFNFP